MVINIFELEKNESERMPFGMGVGGEAEFGNIHPHPAPSP